MYIDAQKLVLTVYKIGKSIYFVAMNICSPNDFSNLYKPIIPEFSAKYQLLFWNPGSNRLQHFLPLLLIVCENLCQVLAPGSFIRLLGSGHPMPRSQTQGALVRRKTAYRIDTTKQHQICNNKTPYRSILYGADLTIK